MIALAGAAVLLPYLDRIYAPTPLYAGDEGAYLIHAFYDDALRADPALVPYLQQISNPVFLEIVRHAQEASPHYLQWLRIAGAAAYVGGIILTYRAIRPSLQAERSLWFLAVALLFPYYRFVFTALPEGWFVAVLGFIVWLTAWGFIRRPALHAALVGVAAAVLVLLKPHGIAVVAAYVALCLLDAPWSRSGALRLLVRLPIFSVAFWGGGNLLASQLGEPAHNPLLFFHGRYYAAVLEGAPGPHAVSFTLLAAIAMSASLMILAAAPVLIASRGIIGRKPRYGRLSQQEACFALVALSLAATILMVTYFAYKATALGPLESRRLWGRYFEFYIPLLWLTAAPFFGPDGPPRPWRAFVSATVLAGLGLLLFAFHKGLIILPWDLTAMGAFPWSGPASSRLMVGLAFAATLAAAASTVIHRRVERVWLACFAALGLLSTHVDHRWGAEVEASRANLVRDLSAASIHLEARSGPTVVVVHDFNTGHIAFLRLEGRARMLLAPPGGGVAAKELEGVRTVIVSGQHPIEGDWTVVRTGPELTILERSPSSDASRP